MDPLKNKLFRKFKIIRKYRWTIELPAMIRGKLGKGKLPDFVIVGAQKCGTTSLDKNLRQHPQIMMPFLIKEIHFFNQHWDRNKDVNWYKGHFKNIDGVCGEATPAYIYFSQYHKRIYDTIPDAKLILALRNPVNRAYSQWNHKKYYYTAHKSFPEIIKQELKKDNLVPQKDDLLKRGFYIDQINSLLKYYPREQLHIIISERMRSNMQEEYNRIFDFLGIKRMENLNFIKNVHSRKYSEPMDKEVENLLYNLYKPYNERLFEFLGYRVQEWES